MDAFLHRAILHLLYHFHWEPTIRQKSEIKLILHSGETDTVALIAVGLTIDVGACAYTTVQTNISLNRSAETL